MTKWFEIKDGGDAKVFLTELLNEIRNGNTNYMDPKKWESYEEFEQNLTAIEDSLKWAITRCEGAK